MARPRNPNPPDPLLEPRPFMDPTPMSELQQLVGRAQRGDRSAVDDIAAHLRRHPDLQRDTGDLGHKARELWLAVAADHDPVAAHSIRFKLEKERQGLLGPDPHPLEALLAEQCLTGWLVQSVFAIQMAEAIQRHGQEPGEIVRLQNQVATQQRKLMKDLLELKQVAPKLPRPQPQQEPGHSEGDAKSSATNARPTAPSTDETPAVPTASKAASPKAAPPRRGGDAAAKKAGPAAVPSSAAPPSGRPSSVNAPSPPSSPEAGADSPTIVPFNRPPGRTGS